MKYLNIGLCIAAMILPISLSADILEDTQRLIDTDDLDSAKIHLEQSVKSGNQEAILGLARIAMLKYDFPEAEKYIKNYENAIRKAKKEPSVELDKISDATDLASEFLERVEDIVVLDSLYVPKADFFRYYKIPSSAGRLLKGSEIPLESIRKETDVAFTNENADFLMWSRTGENGNTVLMESSLLTDGNWSQPAETIIPDAGEGNCSYPFMMADGVTLYYASDGDGSIGGLDIFIASRDATTGEYLQPKNIGMPYNSPYDDYMMAIDEENGVGWWATDRNRLGDYLTIYVYKVNDLRNNYPSDDPDIISKARISDYKSTWKEGEDYSDLITTLRSIVPDDIPAHPDFIFPVPGGEVYTTLDDFPDSTSRTMMMKYRKASAEYEQALSELSELRKTYYRKADASIIPNIKKLEESTSRQRNELKKIRNDIYRALAR